MNKITISCERQETVNAILTMIENISKILDDNSITLRINDDQVDKPRVARVYIEEHLVREIEVEIPKDVTDDEATEYAERLVSSKYNNGDIVLSADDYKGPTLIASEFGDTYTDWHELS